MFRQQSLPLPSLSPPVAGEITQRHPWWRATDRPQPSSRRFASSSIHRLAGVLRRFGTVSRRLFPMHVFDPNSNFLLPPRRHRFARTNRSVGNEAVSPAGRTCRSVQRPQDATPLGFRPIVDRGAVHLDGEPLVAWLRVRQVTCNIWHRQSLSCSALASPTRTDSSQHCSTSDVLPIRDLPSAPHTHGSRVMDFLRGFRRSERKRGP